MYLLGIFLVSERVLDKQKEKKLTMDSAILKFMAFDPTPPNDDRYSERRTIVVKGTD